MAQYVVRHNQNIFDVAVELYGSIEGIFDLLISNPNLSLCTDLVSGITLEYHPYYITNANIASIIHSSAMKIANGNRHVYPKHSNKELAMYCVVPPGSAGLVLKLIGGGELDIDWGDNSDIQTISLDYQSLSIEHWFDNETEERRIKIYGDTQLYKLDLSEFNAIVFCTKPLTVTQLIENTNTTTLEYCKLLQDTQQVSLKGLKISDLNPIAHMHLQELNMENAAFVNDAVLEDYLWGLINNYDGRPGCTVYVTGDVSMRAKEAMERLTEELAWNVERRWRFIINGEAYPRNYDFSNDFSNDFNVYRR